MDWFAIFCGVSLRVHVAYVLPFFFRVLVHQLEGILHNKVCYRTQHQMEIKVLVRLRIHTLIMLCTYLDLRLVCVVYQRLELPDNAKPLLQLMLYAERV